MGEPYFPGWIMIDIISNHGRGIHSSGETSGQHVFCCLACAIAFLKRVSEGKKKKDKANEVVHEIVDGVRKDLKRLFASDKESEPPS